MVHERQGLPLRFETCQELMIVVPGLDEFESDLAADRFGLFRDINNTAAPLA